MSIVSRDLTGSVPSEVTPIRASQHNSAAASAYRTGGKRALDLLVLTLSAPFWLSLIGIAALLIWITEGKSPFYSQLRVGRGGKTFRLWKLRTMVVDADARLEAHLAANPEARAEWDATQKLKNDPRITVIGRILRKTSLDELPQLFNVALGDMSIVGPRPIMVNQRALYVGNAYYQLRPGLTGLWQVSQRNESEFADRVRFDNVYNRVQSLKTDLGVMSKTFGVMLRGTGY
ncbi:sugar transferase [Gymnodinialimonas ulvae]|uniref:sugar transferase n=1 Tax=Gymnodinialimonas ulvae TaxID=3126504 RepID=UPI0030B12D92